MRQKAFSQGKTGHPILLDKSLIPGILADSGEEGLRGAMLRSGETLQRVEVEDAGTLHDADTPEDFSAMAAERHHHG